MPPVAAALLPHPPLLVPELAGAAAAELDPLRAACRRALATVLAAAGATIVVGPGPVWGLAEPSASGSFRPYGADLEVRFPARSGLDPRAGRPAPADLHLPELPPPARLDELPLSLAVAAHLLAGLDPPPTRLLAVTVPSSLGRGAAASIGRALARTALPVPTAGRRATGGPPASGDGVGLVVMGDLSACRTDRAPGGLRPEAARIDASIAEAVRSGQLARLLDLDPATAAELLVGGRVPLQVLAGAYQDGAAIGGRVLYDDAPYGVGYLVAVLTAA